MSKKTNTFSASTTICSHLQRLYKSYTCHQFFFAKMAEEKNLMSAKMAQEICKKPLCNREIGPNRTNLTTCNHTCSVPPALTRSYLTDPGLMASTRSRTTTPTAIDGSLKLVIRLRLLPDSSLLLTQSIISVSLTSAGSRPSPRSMSKPVSVYARISCHTTAKSEI